MNIVFRVSETLLADVRADLVRPHPFAHERVGFIAARAAAGHEKLVIIATEYFPVPDHEYVHDQTMGAVLGQEALRKALEVALLKPVGMFHVHMHTLPSRLWFSTIDLREQQRFVPDFFKVQSKLPHGAIVLSPTAIAGRAWLARDTAWPITEFNIVGSRVKITHTASDGSTDFFA